MLTELNELSKFCPKAKLDSIIETISNPESIKSLFRSIEICRLNGNEEKVEKIYEIFNSEKSRILFTRIISNLNSFEPIMECYYLFKIFNFIKLDLKGKVNFTLIDLKVRIKYFLEETLEKYSIFNYELPFPIEVCNEMFSIVEKEEFSIYEFCLEIYREYSKTKADIGVLKLKVFKFLNLPYTKIIFDFDSFFKMIHGLMNALMKKKNLFKLNKVIQSK